ncbi:MAG: hypothetical protein AAF624_13790, partial [Bacteroidota bacterium]
ERWFRELRGAVSNAAHGTLGVLAEAVTEALGEWWEAPRRLAKLVGYSWWVSVTGTILTSGP